MTPLLCGNASENLYLTFKGGCRKDLKYSECYRCTGCGGRFHKDCILEHFKLEEEHDWGRQEERKKTEAAVLAGKIEILDQILLPTNAITNTGKGEVSGTYLYDKLITALAKLQAQQQQLNERKDNSNG